MSNENLMTKVEAFRLINEEPDTTCACGQCQEMCKNRPCWPTPDEAKKLIEAGYGSRLMDDYWVGEPDIHLLCPAIKGFEGKGAPWSPYGKCTFLTDEGLCEIHHMKPVEGRKAMHQGKYNNGIHQAVAVLWEYYDPFIEEWREKYGDKEDD
jgi:Fe-S-cluster containining protein